MFEGLELSLPKLLAVFRRNIKILIILTLHYTGHVKKLRLTIKRIKSNDSLEIPRGIKRMMGCTEKLINSVGVRKEQKIETTKRMVN